MSNTWLIIFLLALILYWALGSGEFHHSLTTPVPRTPFEP